MKKRLNKKRRKGQTKHPREMGLVFTVKETTVVHGVALGDDGVLHLLRDGQPVELASASVELSYARKKGRKVLLRAPVNPARPVVDPHAHLLEYHAVFAVDTNTRTIRGNAVSAGVLVRGLFYRSPDGVVAEPHQNVIAVEFHNATTDPERITWQLVCEELQRLLPDKRIGILVDSALDNLAGFNTRSTAVVDDWYLPANFALVYSSDAAMDTVANHLIRRADEEATAVLKLIEQSDKYRLYPAPPRAPYSRFCWRPAARTDPPGSVVRVRKVE
jgi:hypothetical protein